MDAIENLATALGNFGSALAKPELREMCWQALDNLRNTMEDET